MDEPKTPSPAAKRSITIEYSDSSSSPSLSLEPSSTESQPLALRVLALLLVVGLRWFDKLSNEWTGAALVMTLLPASLGRTFARLFAKRGDK